MPTLVAKVFKVSKGMLSKEERGPSSGIVLLHCKKVFSCKKKHKFHLYLE